MQRKSFLKLAIRASWSYHILAQTSFQPAPKTFWWAELISLAVIWIPQKNFTWPSGKLRTEFTGPIAKFITGSPSSKYEHRRASTLLHNIQNIRICMGKKPIVSVTYENERISIKNSLPYLKCVLRLSCVVHGSIYGHFMGFYVNGCSEFTAVFLRWISPAASPECPTLVNLYIERKPFT